MPRHMMLTIKVPVPPKLSEFAAELNQGSARVYNKTLSLVRKMYQRKGFWISANTAQKYILRWAADIPLHTHSKQAMVQQYYNALKSYFAARKTNPNARPPFRTKKYLPTIWKTSAIHIKQDKLVLSNGRDNPPFVVPIPKMLQSYLPTVHLKLAKLVWDNKNKRYYIHLTIEVDGRTHVPDERVVAVDLGVIHPITAFDGREVKIWNGGVLNSKLRYKHKRLASIQKALAKTKGNSRKYRKLQRAKMRMLRRLNNQITDTLHKITSNFIKWVIERRASKIVIGDVTGIRKKIKYNKVTNQKIHGWMFRRITNMLTYKAELAGIEVELVSEEYTSQTCPVCGHRHKPANRNFKCPKCGFEYHRDGVGAVNIWFKVTKYPARGQVVAELAPAAGVRYNPHLRGPGISPWKLALSQ